MKVILTRTGLPVFVDDRDHEWLSQYSWRVERTGRKHYVKNENDEYMHRMILGLGRGDGRMGDHRNGCTVDCRRRNLRVFDPRQNCYNLHFDKRNKTGFAGVTPYYDKFYARGRDIHGRRVSLGYHDTAEAAAQAYARNFALVQAHLLGEIDESAGTSDTTASLQASQV